ncbi:hypothetical protein F5B22DRAFT_638255 [Xylaria bambusicola]|uniref:uncharacterized protein n=1 Tax=Xylaria bambusicola TaxID=326684 RepID=UPI00200782F6|nr:uncharacterized protein F5B22DRAFT_638255 [Xylaria bambusicola]KAI0509062.1 hypothetical protein F5B22DRAFT_638255 [Xylaria bambusicola]
MRRARTPPSPYRALAHHPANGQLADSASLIRSFNIETNPTRPIRPSPLTASTFPDMPLDLVDRMRSFPLFMSASDDFLVHAAHDHILTEGDEAKAMYWLVRGVVALKPGSFFGEIGVLMNCLLLVLKKEDLQLELPKFPDMDKAIPKKRQESGRGLKLDNRQNTAREAIPGEVATGEEGKRKSPSPGALEDPAAGSALGSGEVNVRQTLKELPLFSALPPDILHQLGLSAQPKTYAPFTDIIRQGTLGNEIYFIVRGEAEVIHEPPDGQVPKRSKRSSLIRPRLKQGQYFGEVASLGLSQKRTATVRSITVVECLMIPGEALDELWRTCPSSLREQVEETARNRIRKDDNEDIDMTDAESTAGDSAPVTPVQANPQVIFTTPSKPASPVKDESKQLIPKDPDPYLSVDMENLRNRRRASLAPPTPPSDSPGTPSTNGGRPRMIDTTTPIKFALPSMSSPVSEGPTKKARLSTKPTTLKDKGEGKRSLPDDILIAIFQHLNAVDLFRLRGLSTHWLKVLSTSLKLCHNVDLSVYNRRVTDDILVKRLAPFLGHRPVSVDVSNCFHITDEGFSSFWRLCGRNVKVWKMKSVWEVSANQILEMSDHAKSLEEVDWSNCRKVGDNLLARVVGWVVPDHPPQKQVIISSSAARLRNQRQQAHAVTLPPPGTVIGCPQLKRLNLSYCKHITDRSMAHMAAHASNRLQSLSLTRCTSITDAGFQSWAAFRFVNLSHLCLADCTYLSDNAIVALVNAAKSLTHLDLSFCCALSDTATEVVALGLPRLQELKMAFCGSAVSDSSLACISLHLNDLERLSVRGCVRVTASGVESVLEGCGRLTWIDVSQCRNLEGWTKGGGVTRWGYDERIARISGIDIKSMSIIPPRGARNRRARRPVGFVVEKGPGELRAMKQWVTNQDGLDKLRFVDVPEPSGLKEGEVLVKIQRVSLNYRDTEVCMGLYSHHRSIGNDEEIVPTSDCCGLIVKVGPGATQSGLREGDRVASIFNQTHQTGQVVEKDMASGLGLPLNGCLTQYRVFPAYGLVKVPDYLTDDEAACLPIAAVTAWMGINSFQPMGQPLRGKDKVVLLQGTGGVAISGLQTAKVLGLTTIITSSSDKKLELAKSLGADHTINYKTTPNWDDTVLEITKGRGADVVLECGGAQTLSKSFRCVAFGGLISAIGYLSGKEDEAGNRINANVLALIRNVTFKGIINGPKDRFEEMLRVYEREKIRPVVDRTFEFEKADEALKYLSSGGHFGKVVVKVQ